MVNLERTKAADIVKYHNALLKEREFRGSLIKELNTLVKDYKVILGNKTIFENVASMTDSNIIVGKEYFNQVKSLVEQFSAVVATKEHELNEALTTKVAELQVQLNLWKQQENEIQAKIDAKKQELTQAGIPFDLGKINQISKDIIDLEKRVKNLLEEQKKLKDLEAMRNKIIKERIDNKKEIYRLHFAFAKKINSNLRNTIDDFSITVKYIENVYSPDLRKL